MLLKSVKQIKNYFIFVILVALVWVVFLPESNRAYGIVFMMFAGFLVLFLNHFISFYEFTSHLKLCDPFLFNSYSKQFGPYKGGVITNLILLNEKDRLKQIRNEKFQYYYGITSKSLNYALLSFASIILLVILLAVLH